MSIDPDAILKLTKAEIVALLEAAESELEGFRQAYSEAEGDVDWASLQNRTKAQMAEYLKARFARQDLALQRRLRAQAASIHHLLAGRSYEAEMEGLHARAAQLEKDLEAARGRVRQLEGTDVASYNLPALS